MNRESSPWIVLVLAGVALVYFLELTPKPEIPPAPPQPALPVARIKLYFFTMPACVPCKQLKAAMQDSAVQQELAARFDLQMVESPTDPLVNTHSIQGFPTLLALTANGVLKRHSGAMTSAELLTWLKEVP